ncbi:hypothetical protein [Rhizobium laguerreae]|nr:hypothetical protein [Rhizobium laguerreae]
MDQDPLACMTQPVEVAKRRQGSRLAILAAGNANGDSRTGHDGLI